MECRGQRWGKHITGSMLIEFGTWPPKQMEKESEIIKV
jgi:hypothetical protein